MTTPIDKQEAYFKVRAKGATRQAAAKRTVAAQEVLAMKAQPERGAGDERRQDQPPSREEIKPVDHGSGCGAEWLFWNG